MKLFINKTIIFTLLFLCIVIITAILNVVATNYFLHRKFRDSSNSILILGDSHTQSGLNPDYLNRTLNISQTSEAYFYTYYKLKKVIKENPKIDTIILGFSYHNLSYFYDEYLTMPEKSKNMHHRYSVLFDIRAYLQLVQTKPIRSFFSILYSILYYPKFILNQEIPFLGSYYYSERSIIDDNNVYSKIKKYYFKKTLLLETSELQLKYLDLINNLCKQNQIFVILINTPLHISYKQKIPERFLTEYEIIVKKLNFDCLILDYSDLELENSSYGDADHLNNKGAEILSRILNESLKK